MHLRFSCCLPVALTLVAFACSNDSADGDDELGSTDSTDDATDTGSPSCQDIEVDYDGLVAMTECRVDEDCKLIFGACGVGLGGCYYTVNVGVDEVELEALAQLWSDSGCTGGVCDCARPPSSVVCDTGAGTCVGVN